MREEYAEHDWCTQLNGTLRKKDVHVFKRSKIRAGSTVDTDLPELMKETGHDDYIAVRCDVDNGKSRCVIVGHAKNLRDMKAVLKLLGVF